MATVASFFLILETLRETPEQFLLLRYRQRIHRSFNLRERIDEQRLALAGEGFKRSLLRRRNSMNIRNRAPEIYGTLAEQ